MSVVKINLEKHLAKESINIELCEAIYRDMSTRKIKRILAFYRKLSNKRKLSEIC